MLFAGLLEYSTVRFDVRFKGIVIICVKVYYFAALYIPGTIGIIIHSSLIPGFREYSCT